jgi:hypothetical protein
MEKTFNRAVATFMFCSLLCSINALARGYRLDPSGNYICNSRNWERVDPGFFESKEISPSNTHYKFGVVCGQNPHKVGDEMRYWQAALAYYDDKPRGFWVDNNIGAVRSFSDQLCHTVSGGNSSAKAVGYCYGHEYNRDTRMPAKILIGDWTGPSGENLRIAQTANHLTFYKDNKHWANVDMEDNEIHWTGIAIGLIKENRIEWNNNTVWTRGSATVAPIINIGGNWTGPSGENLRIEQTQNDLTFYNNGQLWVQLKMLNNVIQWPGVGTGTISVGGSRIEWSNNTTWTRN